MCEKEYSEKPVKDSLEQAGYSGLGEPVRPAVVKERRGLGVPWRQTWQDEGTDRMETKKEENR